MFKDKKLRKELKDVGILDKDCDAYRSYRWMEYVGEIAKERIRVTELKSGIDRLQKENKELKKRLDAMMELLGITYEEAHKEPAKLKKGAKSVEINKVNDKESLFEYAERLRRQADNPLFRL